MPSPIGNVFMKATINSPLHGLLGERFAVITVTGRKSGRAISTPINVSRDDNCYTVVSTRDRTWWRNLRGDASARLRNAGKTFTVRGEIIEEPGAVREELHRYFQRYPGDAKYFNVHLTPEGKADLTDLEHAAKEKLIVKLYPAK
jgi:deazaflavin-dependent oxidoreductase (nitroreductase family)